MGKRIKLKAQVTKPPSGQAQMYWKCPARGCQHYQYILVGYYPDRASGLINCPICKTVYNIKCLKSGLDLLILAELQ